MRCQLRWGTVAQLLGESLFFVTIALSDKLYRALHLVFDISSVQLKRLAHVHLPPAVCELSYFAN